MPKILKRNSLESDLKPKKAKNNVNNNEKEKLNKTKKQRVSKKSKVVIDNPGNNLTFILNDSGNELNSSGETITNSIIINDYKNELNSSGETIIDSVSSIGSIDLQALDVILAENGQRFYPCTVKECCCAFPSVEERNDHTRICSVGKSLSNVNTVISLETVDKIEVVTKSLSPEVIIIPEAVEDTEIIEEILVIPPNLTDGDTSVITTDSVTENINNVSDDIRNLVLQNIKRILSGTNISVIVPKNGPIILQSAPTDVYPALHITSRNLDDTSVEIKTVPIHDPKNPQKSYGKLPDIAEILEYNFGSNRPKRIPRIELAEESTSVPVRKGPKSVKSIGGNNDSICDETETLGEMVIDEIELDGCIILEDLDIHICKQCGSVYHSLEDLVNHDKYEHRHCRKRYPVNELFKYDLQYKNSKNGVCPICFKTIRNKDAWPRHLQTHNEKASYECRICKRKFTRKDHRQIHERRHVVPLTEVKKSFESDSE